jgi:diketogulonate reductase-like aldo/keto reductase
MLNDTSVVSAYGVNMPRILYGTAWKKERTADLVEQAITLGFRGIDTACQPKHYHEAGVGEGLARCLATGLARDEIYLQTKFTPLDGQDPKRLPYDPKASLTKQVRQSFEVSLQNLQTDYLDCLVLHSPLSNEAQFLEVWRAMEKLVQSGSVKQLGLSNCYQLVQLQWLYQQADIKPAILQNRFYAQTHYDHEIREFCQQQNIQYESFWTLTANTHILLDDGVIALADKYKRSTEQVFFRYLTQRHIVPLTGTTSAEHMREDLAIFEFALADNELSQLDRLFSRSHALHHYH